MLSDAIPLAIALVAFEFLEGSPQNVDVSDLIEIIKTTKGIRSIHDLYVWTITSGFHALSCHVVVDD